MNIDLMPCTNHIENNLSLVESHRINVETETEKILASVNQIASVLGVSMEIPRVTARQVHRSNPPASTPEEYWRKAFVIPYLDSLMTSLKDRFSQENEPAFSLFYLHPSHMLNFTVEELHEKLQASQEFYDLDISEDEIHLWYNLWKMKDLPTKVSQDLNLMDVAKEAANFFPSVETALFIALTLPCTTSTIERSFCTLRRVKTWLRSTMESERLAGLCLLNSHREKIISRRREFEKEVLDRFAEDPRRLVLL